MNSVCVFVLGTNDLRGLTIVSLRAKKCLHAYAMLRNRRTPPDFVLVCEYHILLAEKCIVNYILYQKVSLRSTQCQKLPLPALF